MRWTFLLSSLAGGILMSGLALSVSAQTKAEMEQLRQEVTQNLTENILPFWMENTVDPDGGFYGVVMNDGKAADNADKGAVLNARILWTFSKAYRHYGLESYRQTADRAAEYYLAHFIDRKYEGVYWALTSEGVAKNTTKQTYASAFGIYGLAEHFRATGDKRSLEAAIKLYQTLESKVHDKAKLGYIEMFQRDYTRGQQHGVDGHASASKTMNTHIHVLEAYTTLYQVWPNDELKANLKELLGILSSKLYDQKRAAVVGDPDLKARVEAQAVKMARTALDEGLDNEGAMRYEKTSKGYSSRISWWPQCETVIGAVNAWQLTGDRRFFDAAVRNWAYVKAHLVDQTNGGWYKDLDEQGKPSPWSPKASEWNCPYHNSRMGYELAERLL